MGRIFISYSRLDGDFVRRLNNELRKQGRDTWVDWQSIPRGERWLNVIFEGIESASSIVCVISRNSLTSEICNEEISYAFQRNKRILPLILEPIENEVFNIVAGRWLSVHWEKKARANWEALNALNWVLFNDESKFDSELYALLQALETDHAYVEDHTRYLVRALEWDRQGQKPSQLLFGDEIDKAEAWLISAVSKQPQAHPLHQTFIYESRMQETVRQSRAKAQEQRTRRLRSASWALLFTALLAIGGTLAAVNSAQRAENARQESEVFRTTVEAEATLFVLDRQQEELMIRRLGIVPTEMQNITANDIVATATAQVNPTVFPIETRSDKGAEMVHVPMGCFWMGSINDGASPVHWMCLDESYWIDRYEVTSAQYRACSDCPPNDWLGDAVNDQQPAIGVNWWDAHLYCSNRGDGVRLPNEAEWEFAARGPSSNIFPWGDVFNPSYAVYIDNAQNRSHEVGERPPQSASWVGAFDMSGNVAEWVSTAYAIIKLDDPTQYVSFFRYPYVHDEREAIGPEDRVRVVRGGSFNNEEELLHAANRQWLRQDISNPLIGFRCAMSDTVEESQPDG